MKFAPTKLAGVWLVHMERQTDERGYFARTWCERELASHGLESRLVQCSVSFSTKKGTLRGMHYQSAPAEETKLVRCARGAIYDVVIDLRRSSPTFKQWIGVELREGDGTLLYVAKSCAHGFQTLMDATEVVYQMSEFHEPASTRGVRWNDPAFGVTWPDTSERVLSARDASYPNFPC